MINWIQRKRNKKGFTLIELIVVVAILGILMAIAIPRFIGVRPSANAKSIDANITTVQSNVEVLAADKNVDVENIATTNDKGTITATGAAAAGDLAALIGNWPKGPGDVVYTVVGGVAQASIPSTGSAPPVPTDYNFPRTYSDIE